VRALVLFTRDLRTHDHPALSRACREANQVVPLFVLDPALLGISSNRTRFLLESLLDLDRSLGRLGGRLFARRGPAPSEAIGVARTARCSAIYVTADVTAYARRRQLALAAGCAHLGVDLHLCPGHAVVEPAAAPAGRDGYRVFTPYFRAWTERSRREVLPVPSHLSVPDDLDPGPELDPRSITPDALDLPPGGERAGRRRLHRFLGSELATYARGRDDLSTEGTSRLSPYLRFGCVSANEVAARAKGLPGADAFVRQLAWRDFFRQLLSQDPALAWRDQRTGSGGYDPSAPVDAWFQAWCEGRTGVPLVDAAVRQLRREGWIENRARMVAASFLTRRLGIPWQLGAGHFSRFLVDGEPANNAGNWQWVAGTGANPRRGRVLNPVRQARRHDPEGAYIRRYVCELSDVRAPAVFAPWTDPALLRRTGYPRPLVPVVDEPRGDPALPSAASSTSAAATTSSPR
jgi:deoxyribodipyrimidine photo-lyase